MPNEQESPSTLPPDFKPLDPSGISDLIHDLHKSGRPASLREALLDYQNAHRVC